MPVDLALGQNSLKRRRISQDESKKNLGSLTRDDIGAHGTNTQRVNKKAFRALNGSMQQFADGDSLGGGTFQANDLQ